MKDTGPLTAIDYHEASKHHYHQYARSLGFLDWENQPHPFRFYEGLTPVKLPLAKQDPDAGYLDLYERTSNPVREFSLDNLGHFLELSLGLSAWKAIPGAKWALRMNPSSGNLHPTEGYLILKTKEACEPGVYHYSPFLHALEPRSVFPDELSRELQESFPATGFFFALTSIHWREAWKYGERAFRYCNHDIGHALAAASFAANLMGWKLTYLHEAGDEEIGRLLGFHQTAWAPCEQEYPELLAFIHAHDTKEIPSALAPELIGKITELSFQGRPNQLSKDPENWDIIPETAKITAKPRGPSERPRFPDTPFFYPEPSPLKAARIIRQRRSLQSCDGVTGLSKAAFLAMLDKTLPRENKAPFDLGLGPARVHLLIFVHRVHDLAPGLYFFIRDENEKESLRQAARPEFFWSPVEKEFPLYLLAEGEFTRKAESVSCQQAIAGDGAFSLGMITKFRAPVESAPFLYRHLFWETGMIGQVLYLEAEAHGIRSTGIGCFFDDPVHDLLGLKDNTFQSLYHFTVGKQVEDLRLQTWPPYSHVQEGAPAK